MEREGAGKEGTEGLIQWLSAVPSLWHECIRGSRTRCLGLTLVSVAPPLRHPFGISLRNLLRVSSFGRSFSLRAFRTRATGKDAAF